jgi:hypothetical protein
MGVRLLRSIAAGSSIVLGKELFHHRADVGALAACTDERVRYLRELEGADYPPPKTPREALLIAAAAGAAGGAGYVLFSWLTPGRGALRGAAYGATFWMFNELLFRNVPNRAGETFVHPEAHLGGLVTFGALLGWLVDR